MAAARWLLCAALLLTSMGAGTGAPAVERRWQRKMAAITERIAGLGIPYDYGSCVRRVQPAGIVRQRAALGIVAVLCTESLAVYNKIGCRDGLIHYHVYSKCGMDERQVHAAAPKIAGCMSVKSVQSTVYTDLAWAKAHSEYLEHVIDRYNSLERSLIFTKAKVGKPGIRDVLDLTSAVDEALSGEWAYRPLWPTKFSVRFSECPMTCNAEQFGRELCALYKRYTCEADCYSCPNDNAWMDVASLVKETRMEVSRCFFPNPRSTFITSAARLQSLPVAEYMWLREWLQSWQEGGGGIFRRLMGERLWPVLLGCPEDIHHNTSDGGCLESMRFPSGKRTDPPAEMIEDGLVHHPALLSSARHLREPRLHTSRHVYPHLMSPKHGDARRITFVSFYGAPPPDSGDVLPLLQAAFASVLQFHPSARFLLMVKREEAEGLRRAIAREQHWFAGRLEIQSVTLKQPPTFGSRLNAAELRAGRWMHAHRAELSAAFLRTWVSRDPAAGGLLGHVVLLPLGSLLLEDLWAAFAPGSGGRPFALAAPALEAAALGSAPLLLHRERLHAAAAALLGALGELLPQGGTGRGAAPPEDWAAAITQRLLGCLSGAERASLVATKGMRTAGCPATPGLEAEGDGSGSSVVVRLLPCAQWGARHVMRGHSAAPGGCSADLSGAKIVMLEPADGLAAMQVIAKMREYAEPSVHARAALGSL